MIDTVAVGVGVLLGLWSTIRLECATATLVRRRRLALLDLFAGLALRLVLMCVAVWALLVSSPTATLLALAGYWFARTAYLAGTVLGRRQIA